MGNGAAMQIARKIAVTCSDVLITNADEYGSAARPRAGRRLDKGDDPAPRLSGAQSRRA